MRSKSNEMTYRCMAAVVSGLMALTTVTPALAQTGAKATTTAAPAKKLTAAQAKEAAKKAYGDAEAKFAKGDFAGAAADYKTADELIPGAVPKFKYASSLDKQNKATDAVAAYQAFLDSKPEAKHQEKIDEATARITALKATPATITVAVEPANAENLKLIVDGAPQKGTELSLAPGHHSIVAKADGFEGKQEIDVAFAETRTLTLALTPVAPAAAEPTAEGSATIAPTAAATTTEAPEAPKTEKRSNIPAYITLGIAAVGVGVGTGFGIAALGSKSDYNKAPSRDGLDTVERQALLADMSFAVGVTFGITGLVLLLTNTGDSAPKASAMTRPIIAPYATPQGGGAAAMMHF